MVYCALLFGLFGYSVGYEGYDQGKYYFGVYGKDVEYGYVVGSEGVYLDTVMDKCPR
jgi:hypothetical protein